ncbi:hypothetical protein O0L34_g15367 [Tuta absoluta]|nr:hypothetical protein O0L34_g15367 [Tuta absoluta]
MVLDKKTVLPRLESIGPGLDRGGFTLRGIRDHMRITALQETLSHAGFFRKQQNNEMLPFKFSYVRRNLKQTHFGNTKISANTTSNNPNSSEDNLIMEFELLRPGYKNDR